MSSAVQAFDDEAVTGRSRLDQVATLLTSPAMCPDDDEMLVIALRPDHDKRRVISSAGNSAVRASISVSIAAGNQRAWASATPGQIVDVPVMSLPEIIRAAILPSGLQTVRVSSIGDETTVDCLVMWLSRSTSVCSEAYARQTTALQNLSDAATRDRVDQVQLAEQQAQARAEAQAAAVRVEPTEDVDVLTTLPRRREFDDALAGVRSDETGLIVLGIDNIAAIREEFGSDTAEQVRRAVATRLSGAVRRNDVVAWIGDNVFAVLLVDVDRRAAFEISKRLRADASAPVEVSATTVEVSLSVGLSHEVGLIDPAELFVAAESAMEDAHQAGGARMLVAC